ncbi:MAG: hypothetical protein DA408_06695 [Bacteroidetes bacterium]|nr:MAG: hypothetical protein DA408_06695 [Bacteroidota bacterium]
MLIRIAWRNVWRNKTRSLVIIIAVVVGLWGGVFSDAFMQGMTEQQIYSTIHTETGHIQLNQPGFLQNFDLQKRITNADSLVAILKTNPAVAGAAAIVRVTAMATTASSSAGIMVNGIQPSDQQVVSNLSQLLVQGDYFKSNRANEAVIGQQLADKLHVKLKSRIVLTLQTVSGDLVYGAFKVAGIYRTHDSDFDQQMFFVRNQDLQALIDFPPAAASVITVLLHQSDDTEPMAASLQEQFPDLQVQSWVQLAPMLQAMSGTMLQFSLIFVGVILIALAFGIINTMLMAVLDRTREIGMLLSIGMRPAKVFGMIMLETIFLSLTGAIIGVLVSVASISWFGQHGIDLSIVAEGFNALGYSSKVYPSLGADFYLILTCMVIGIAVVAGLFPARRAIRLKPAEAVRGE